MARAFPSANKAKKVCAHFAASVRASPHDRRPDPLFGRRASWRCKVTRRSSVFLRSEVRFKRTRIRRGRASASEALTATRSASSLLGLVCRGERSRHDSTAFSLRPLLARVFPRKTSSVNAVGPGRSSFFWECSLETLSAFSSPREGESAR